jgi:hypothetical protein
MPNSPKTDLREAKIGREKTPIEPVWRPSGARFGYKVNDIPCGCAALLTVRKKKKSVSGFWQKASTAIGARKAAFERRFRTFWNAIWYKS